MSPLVQDNYLYKCPDTNSLCLLLIVELLSSISDQVLTLNQYELISTELNQLKNLNIIY